MVTKRIIELDTTAEIRDDDIFLPLDSSLDGTNKVSVGNIKQYVLNAVKQLETTQLKALIGFEMFLAQRQENFITLGRKTYVRCGGTRTTATADLIQLPKALYPDYYEYVRLGVQQGYTHTSTASATSNIKLPPSRINLNDEVCYAPRFDGEYLRGMGVKSGTFDYTAGGLPDIRFDFNTMLIADSTDQSHLSPGQNMTDEFYYNDNYTFTIPYGSGTRNRRQRIKYSSKDTQKLPSVTGNKPLVDALEVNMYVLVKIED